MQTAREIVPGVSEFVDEARDLSQELKATVQDLMFCIRHTRPSKQFLAELILGTISLEMTIKRLDKTQDITKQRELLAEFHTGSETIHKGIWALWDRAGISQEEVAVRGEALVIATRQNGSAGSIPGLNLPGQAEEV